MKDTELTNDVTQVYSLTGYRFCASNTNRVVYIIQIHTSETVL